VIFHDYFIVSDMFHNFDDFHAGHSTVVRLMSDNLTNAILPGNQ